MIDLFIILLCILLGIFLGIFYTFFKYTKYQIFDFIYWILSSYITISLIENINNGIFRFYFLIFFLIGYIIYYKLLEKHLTKRFIYFFYYLYRFKKYLKWLAFPKYIVTGFKKFINKFKKTQEN